MACVHDPRSAQERHINADEVIDGGSAPAAVMAIKRRSGDYRFPSFCASCGVKDSKGTRRSGADAVPKMSPGSRSRYPKRGVICQPEPTKCSEGYWRS